LVRNLFKPKQGQDFEIDPNALGEDYRLSGGSQQSSQPISRTSSNQQPPGMAFGGMPPPGARASQQRGQVPMSAGAGVGMGGPPFLHSQPSNLTQASNSSSMKGGNASGPMKVKVFFQDDIIALRVPGDIVFAALREKLLERLKINEDVIIQYKDEPTNSLIDLESDDNLDVALQRNPKLTLYVNYAAG